MNTETKTNNTTGNQSLIERLFAAGAHFGFTKSRRHPTVVPYLFGSKQGTDIFDLEKTSVLLEEAKAALNEAGKAGKTVLFVGSKDEVATIVKQFAEQAEMPYVTNRWIGGMLTNFSEIKRRIARLTDLTEQGEQGELERKYTKKERVVIGRELEKLNFNFGGMKTLERLPQMLLVVDPRHNEIAVQEANDLNIPVVGVTSSDYNLRNLKHPVVVNDALQSSVTLVLEELTAAYTAGKAEYVPPKREDNRRHTRG
ncbi:MAG: 30S ribosomal protein S2 [Candidatus Pacebacteria bacterium]|nr:30S ribosomal protein S2 [Candidatus Paceibacterota bacterium]